MMVKLGNSLNNLVINDDFSITLNRQMKHWSTYMAQKMFFCFFFNVDRITQYSVTQIKCSIRQSKDSAKNENLAVKSFQKAKIL